VNDQVTGNTEAAGVTEKCFGFSPCEPCGLYGFRERIVEPLFDAAAVAA
jgi:hypothetical protein